MIILGFPSRQTVSVLPDSPRGSRIDQPQLVFVTEKESSSPRLLVRMILRCLTGIRFICPFGARSPVSTKIRVISTTPVQVGFDMGCLQRLWGEERRTTRHAPHRRVAAAPRYHSVARPSPPVSRCLLRFISMEEHFHQGKRGPISVQPPFTLRNHPTRSPTIQLIHTIANLISVIRVVRIIR